MKKIMRWLGLFLREQAVTLSAFCAFFLIIAGVMRLYQTDLEIIVYALVICLVTGFLILVAAFMRYCKKQSLLESIEQNVLLRTEELPDAGTAAERQYALMVRELAARIRQMEMEREAVRNENVDYFTTWVHQIKTPLAVMKLELQQEDTEMNRLLLSQLFLTEQYVELVLCHFRLDSYSNDFVIGAVDLDEVIKKSVRKYSQLFIRKRIRLDFTPTGRTVVSDAKWLGFIVEQILSNAVKYTEKGCVRIWADKSCVLHIADTGIGIAREDIPRIFEKGYTGYNGREDKKSTGLGLYLCGRAAEKLAHTISVESAVGEGSDFQIDLARKYIGTE